MKLYRFLQICFYYLVPLFIAFFIILVEQETSTKLNFTGLVALVLIFLSFYKRFRDYKKEKLHAHETAKNLGQISQSVNFILLGVLNFTFTVIPFIIVVLIDNTLKSYTGNAAVGISFLILSFGLSEFFGVLYRTNEQKKIQDDLYKKTEKENERLAKVIKSKI